MLRFHTHVGIRPFLIPSVEVWPGYRLWSVVWLWFEVGWDGTARRRP